MAASYTERVLDVRHWNEHLFSFTCTRDSGLRFDNGQFVMIGLMVDGRPLLRAYSIASPNYEENLEFFSIKVQNGPLTSRLQHLQPGDTLLISKKPTGSLVIENLKPGGNLYLLSTGTGLAPFLSVIHDPDFYETFDRIILTHGVREVSELGYHDYILNELPENEYIGELVKEKLMYYPTVTREPFRNQGRLTDLIRSGKLADDLGLPELNPQTDRVMICGSPAMLAELVDILKERGFTEGTSRDPGEYVIERAFVEK